jgi:hypothetical protein
VFLSSEAACRYDRVVNSGEVANEALINGFYEAFGRLDHETMAAAYAPGATFEDPAFGRLESDEIGAMWRMLCQGATDLEISHRDVSCDAETGSAHWDADYTFSRTGRKVHNSIDAAFTFENGLIKTHRDSFSMWRWTRQALGPAGLLLGWTPILPALFRRTARAQLEKFIAES